MYQKRKLISIVLVMSIFIATIPGFSTAAATTNEGLTFDYLVSYTGDETSAPRVTIVISNISTAQLELIISPMSIFVAGENQNLWLVDTQQVTATSDGGQSVPMTDGGIISVPYHGQAADYRLLDFNTSGQSTITIKYMLNQRKMTGYLETYLLRPRDHSLVGNATLRIELPTDWKAVTVLTEEQNGNFLLGSMDSFYADNQNPVYNFVPAAFAVGPQDDIIEVDTNCGRLIYAYHADTRPLQADSTEALLGKAIFEYYCNVVGPLAPYNAYINSRNSEWYDAAHSSPGLYSFDGQHNRTMDLGQSEPEIEYHPWEWTCFTGTSSDCADYETYGFPHKLLRGLLSTGKGGLLYLDDKDWFFRGGISQYFQEMAMSLAFGQHKVYERFQDLFNYYQTNYVQTGLDQPIACPNNSNEKNCSFLTNFKSGLWAFYLNQRILEVTGGEKNISDVSRYLYAAYAGLGQPVTYSEIQEAVNIVASTDLSEAWTRYAYGNESLPLDTYFQDNDQDGLVNGLEIERHTNPNSADTNGNGIDDAVEYAMDCAQTALNPYYCYEIVPPNARGIQLISTAESLLASIPPPCSPSTYKEDFGSTEVSIDLGNSAITLDGFSSDWPEISPLAADPQDTGPYDFKTLYGFSDANNLYLRIDPNGIFPQNRPEEFGFDIIAQTDEGQSRFHINTFPCQIEEVQLAQQVDETSDQWEGQKLYSGAALDQVFEIIIPLEYLGYPKSVTINASASIVEGSTRRGFDSFDPVTLSIGSNLPANNPIGPSSTNSSWHDYWNSFWWIIPILVGAGILIGVVIIFRKKKQ
jgi:hypothetical protein